LRNRRLGSPRRVKNVRKSAALRAAVADVRAAEFAEISDISGAVETLNIPSNRRDAASSPRPKKTP
ncbi:MAG: hypothetical protein IJY15_04145, partial [Thermoguttaceae bacterium]|nr:hypothetical protein [Thermoguttaceae bacterium]